MKLSHNLRFTVRGFSAKRMAYLLIGISALLIPFHWRADYQGDAYLAVGLPNQSVERTGMSRSGQSRFQRHWRLIPVAHLCR